MTVADDIPVNDRALIELLKEILRGIPQL